MRVLLPALCLVLPLLSACRGNRLPVPGSADTAAPTASRPAPYVGPALPARFDTMSGKNVRLAPQDLEPIDDWLGVRNTQWIIGDTVDVYASKEYFASMLTLNAKTGLVQRQETEYQGDTIITLTYVGAAHAMNAMRAPRAFIGKEEGDFRNPRLGGFTISARKVLRLRMAKTRDPSRPVQLRVLARGQAVHGRHEEVERRADQIEIGGALRHAQGRWWWVPVER